MKKYCLHIYTLLRKTPQVPCRMRCILALTLFILNISFSEAQTITIGGSVFGGGEVGKVDGDANVEINNGTIGSLNVNQSTDEMTYSVSGGDVYGGGNKGDLDGKTTVTLRGGNIHGGVFGGARMANVAKSTLVHVDGADQRHDLTVNFVYGGNDISGTVGEGLNEGDAVRITNPDISSVDNSFQTYIHTTKEETGHHIFIGQMFGGGNGAYTYEAVKDGNDNITGYNIIRNSDGQMIATSDAVLAKPEVDNAYVQVNGGTFGYVFAGGNNATVKEHAVISINNGSDVTHATDVLKLNFSEYNASGTKIVDGVTSPEDINNPNIEDNLNSNDVRLLSMGINLSTYTNERNFIRVFGGNNQVDMAIMPTWNLAKGSIHNLYSGGNQGDMTSPSGILLDIPETSNIDVENVYGGCRMANVLPKDANGNVVAQVGNLPGYNIPVGLSARVIVRGGTIKNVYGGNDITGNVFGGTAIGIRTSISGDVYGGGNGSYAYTDNPALKDDVIWGDFYYDKGSSSIDSLYKFRPHVEQVSIRVVGKEVPVSPGSSETKVVNTVVGGSIYCGGNSATLLKRDGATNEIVELKIGSYAICDKVYLGNNGAQMVDNSVTGPLVKYAGYVHNQKKQRVDFSSLNLNDASTFAKYMDGCAMQKKPSVVFDGEKSNDPNPKYIDYTTYFGSFFCGGNVGSMTMPGKTSITFNYKVVIFDKLVAGCNNANVPSQEGLVLGATGSPAQQAVNAEFLGGVLGTKEEQANEMGGKNGGSIGDVLELNLSNLKIQPKRWKVLRGSGNSYKDPVLDANGNLQYLDAAGNVTTELSERVLEWNTVSADNNTTAIAPVTEGTGTVTDADRNRRFKGGNVYGGCYNSGRVIGNVIINLGATLVDKDMVFDQTTGGSDILYENHDNSSMTISQRVSGVLLDEQGMDPLGDALSVFGGGYGADTEIWGSTNINLNKGFTFQIYGGSQEGTIGKKGATTTDPRYSTYINMNGTVAGVPSPKEGETIPESEKDIAEAEFIYGGGFEGPVVGDTHVYLGNGRIFNSFAGCCNADILGHTETYVGRNRAGAVGFPYVRDHLYGGNDLGGKILGEGDFMSRVNTATREMVHGYTKTTDPGDGSVTESSLTTKASAYVEYRRGHVNSIFGGCYGDYDYRQPRFDEYTYTTGGTGTISDPSSAGYNLGSARDGFSKPRLTNAFVNFLADVDNSTYNTVNRVYGAGEGYMRTDDGYFDADRDNMQERSYVLIDIPQTLTRFGDMVVFGAGQNGGLGMERPKAETTADDGAHLDEVSAIIDLAHGRISNVYGGSYEEGVTRRTVVNVPENSTITVKNIFGGAYGLVNDKPCDVYESHVNYSSHDAQAGGIYGGNNNARRTLFAEVNINDTVWSNKEAQYQGYIYGAGYGENSWAHYTNINLNNGAVVYKAWAGGSNGQVLNEPSLLAWKAELEAAGKSLDLTLGGDYTGDGYTQNYHENDLAPWNEMAQDIADGTIRDRGHGSEKYNTNLHVYKGATVLGYCYGGGYGPKAVVSGDTYIDVLGGIVAKDVYAAGESGPVMCYYPAAKTKFIATTNAYIKSGQVRNVYGGGWKGDVGYHGSATLAVADDDIDGRTNVVIGNLYGTCLEDGIPVVLRSVYGGGEGGAIYGTTNLNVNNGYIGYRYEGTDPSTFAEADYVEELDDWDNKDPEKRKNGLERSGNLFGGGYIANSYTEIANVALYKGVVRGSVYGGGEIGPIGRGTVKADAAAAPINNANAKIYKPGATHVYVYGGHVLRNVFGGGRGYDNWGGDGTELYKDQPEILAQMDLESKGYVFGETDVHIYGGIIGTTENMELGYGNVFGGGDIGFVYSSQGKKLGTRGDAISNQNGLPENGGGFYYKYYDEDGPISTGANADQEAISRGMVTCTSVEVAPYCQVLPGKSITFSRLETTPKGEYVRDANGNLVVATTGETQITFNAGDYVPNEYLNLLQNKSTDGAKWDCLDISGVHIYNAVFAGGNVSTGSDQIFVNTNTVYGNATASLRDVYHRDLITVGTEHVGGLYGDGNLTFVDGFRELHISNYGTDYYGMGKELEKSEYDKLTDRERAYFDLQYENTTPVTDKNNTTYEPGKKFTLSDLKNLFQGTAYVDGDGNPKDANWKQMGVCTIYAGRLLNTVQRADFVGIWGSRMVLQGARDRVPEVADYTNYTINRVGEVSLNKINSIISADAGTDGAYHGNYFGIYNIVNYLGNLTSDNAFFSVRTTDVSKDSPNEADGRSYHDWKLAKKTDRYRNNATSHNKVALASGVYLELINEPTAGSTGTNWGYITGVVELDLINVKQGLGGGYVYARNEHGKMKWHGYGNPDNLPVWEKVTLNPLNEYAVTYRRFEYDETESLLEEIETSGNFVHNTKQIVDDCYPMHNQYKGADASPAHYWYIKGNIYVYDQYISAYTGSATSYSEKVSIPLTISAASHGRMTLREVQPNLYAYLNAEGQRLGLDEKVEINGKRYSLNEPITWWDWSQLTEEQQSRFKPDTYTIIEKCKIGSTEYPVGYTMLEEEYETLINSTEKVYTYNTKNETYEENDEKKISYFVRSSNNVSHDTGYVLTYKIDNPAVWNQYYTHQNNITDKKDSIQYKALTDAQKLQYIGGPTYHLKGSKEGIYGQKEYAKNDIIADEIFETYQTLPATAIQETGKKQASFEQAWVTTQEISVNGMTLNAGVAIAQADYESVWGSVIVEGVNVVEAKVITSTLQLSEQEYLYAGDVLSESNIKAQVKRANPTWTDEEVNDFVSQNSGYIAKAYYCTDGGQYGGNLYQPGKAYKALEAWSGMSAEDRNHFVFNYDAFDLLIDPSYGGDEGFKYQYDGYKPNGTTPMYDGATPLDPKIYSVPTSVDYTARYNGTTALTWTDEDGHSQSIAVGEIVTRQRYEEVPNEKYHYAPLDVTSPGDYYVVREDFIRGDIPYAPGTVLSLNQYQSLDATQKGKVDVINVPADKAGTDTGEALKDASGNPTTDDRGFSTKYSTVKYYYCRDKYNINEHGEGQNITTVGGITSSNSNHPSSQTTYSAANGDLVEKGVIIEASTYNNLVNKTVIGTGTEAHLAFTIIGAAPLETSTLYVSRESDIFDLSKEKIITVAYLYEYEESDESGTNITPISERHIVNIHLQFKSGVPQIGEITKPNTVLPGSTVGMKVPQVTTGAFEVLSSGWEVFANEDDAASHKNGTPFTNNSTRVYWYQDNYQIAYYTKTYLGKTYSNYVALSVGNYHDIADVMADKDNHMFIDHKDTQRPPKIYIDNHNSTGANELILFKDLFDLTLKSRTDSEGNVIEPDATGALAGHYGVNTERIGAGQNLEFFLHDNMSPGEGYDWQPIGTDAHCFEGTLHGEGYSINGLNNSLFHHLCGNVYNLGVTGTFQTAGIVDTGTGYLENCWVKTDGAPTSGVKPLFNNPTRNETMDGGKYAGKLMQMVNCYYPEKKFRFSMTDADKAHGEATEMPLKAFYNGEVAYDLNGFYLNKRYYDHNSATGYAYKYLDADDLDAENKPQLKDGTFPVTDKFDYDYVSSRYSNVDFTFSGGTVPTTEDQRLIVEQNSTYYSPIWPDDYIFFGQMLTYGHVTTRDHQEAPSHINKSGSRLQASASSNRVYRAPAYFQSAEMDKAHFNPAAIFAAKSKDGNHIAYQGMTAIDFTGGNGDVEGGYKLGRQANGHFFPPLLDDDGLVDFQNIDLTSNLLAYIPQPTTSTAASKTYGVITDYLEDPVYSDYFSTSEADPEGKYKTVDRYSRTASIRGHRVVKNASGTDAYGTDYTAPVDHFLVDRQDFNAPISYTFASGKRMWYQRIPSHYVDLAKGWEGVSLPFTANLVTTNTKGEITHFYKATAGAPWTQDYDTGHEYWLREFNGNLQQAKDDNENVIDGFYTADFNAPISVGGDGKTVTNTFLYDYYYSKDEFKDHNSDKYHGEYYAAERTYPGYPCAANGTPYLIGFPGSMYYEFDLSGEFIPKNTYVRVEEPLSRQTVTFASVENATIGVSDTELNDHAVTREVTADGAQGNYTFRANYMSKSVAAGSYLLNAEGSAYEHQSAAATPVPFRPYFTYQAPATPHPAPSHITFNSTRSSFEGEDEGSLDGVGGRLDISAQKGRIVVQSSLEYAADVRIFNAAGALIKVFTVNPGETVETRIRQTGIYVVGSGLQTKKYRVEGR